ncbi:hypothetical protein D3C77_531190 [compost metagenome]
MAIGNNDIEWLLAPADVCNLTILCLAGVMAEKTQLLAQHLAINSVIIHHQHLQPIPRPCLGQDWHVAYINVFKDLQTHFDINPGSTPQIAGQHHPAPHHFTQRATDYEA